MTARQIGHTSLIVGVFLILAGILVPAATLVESLRATPGDLLDQLLVGATLFKISLVVLGAVIVILGRLSIWETESPNERAIPNPRRKLSLAILAFVLLSGLALRLYKLDVGLWLDEIMTYVNYARMPFGQIISTYDSENQHFLYSLLAHMSFRSFGESAWSLRLPAALFGVASIWALYLFGRQVSDTREALLSAALAGFSYHHLWFSQNARGYSGLLFWTLLSSWLLARALREARPKLWLLYAAAAALGVYTHTTMAFVIVGHLVIYLIALITRSKEAWSQRWTGFFLGFCFAGLLTLVLHALVLPQIFSTVGGSEQSMVTEWKNPLWTLLEIIKGLQISFLGGLVALVAVLLFSAGVLSYVRTNPITVQLLIIPAVIGAAVVIGIGHHLWPRFFFFAMGFGVLVFIRGITVLGNLVARFFNLPADKAKWVSTALSAGLILVSSASMTLAYGPKQDYAGALEFVEANRDPDDAVVTVGLATFAYKDFYQTDWREVETLDALNAISSGAGRTWLVYTFPPVLESVHPEIMTSIQQEFQVVKKFYGTVGSGTVFVCQSEVPDPRASIPDTAAVGSGQ